MTKQEKSKHTIEHHLSKRILIMDGAMGTMIQDYKLTEKDFRGSQNILTISREIMIFFL